MKRKFFRILLPALATAFLMAGCAPTTGGGQTPAPSATPNALLADLGEPIHTPEPTPDPTPTPTPTPPPKVTLMAVGDDLLHMGVINTGQQSDGSYNYDMLFADISDLIQAADISVINQETIFGGNHLGFSGYPQFNSPTEVGDAIIKAGFNVVLQATNHTADKGLEGIQNCISYWQGHPEIVMAGLHEKYEPAEGETPEQTARNEALQRIKLMTVNDITFAILDYTYSHNSATLASYARGRLDILCNWDPSSGALDFTTLHPDVLTDIALAEELADVVIVFPHWGTEYQTSPSVYQQNFAKQMTEAGADLIIGTHPHVIQPVEWITSDNGNECLCYYSLGNYVSTQKDPITMLENMAWVTFTGTDDGVIIDREATGSIPLVNQYSTGPLRFSNIYLLEDYSQELADKHGIRVYGEKNLYYDQLLKWSQEILGDSVKSVYELTGLREKTGSKPDASPDEATQ